MKKDQLHRQFLPREIVLKLHRDIPGSEAGKRISVIKEYAFQVRDSFDEDVFAVKLNNEIGFCYLDAGEYPLATEHFEKVVEKLKPENYPTLYFLVLGLLIRCNRLMSNHDKASAWTQQAFNEIDQTPSSFEKLNLLKEYADLTTASQQPFQDGYLPVIQYIIDDMGFPKTLADPVETINSMHQANATWSRKLANIMLMHFSNKSLLINAFEEYLAECKIKWYRDYAADRLSELQ